MKEIRKFYESDDITVSFNPKLCIHAAECVNGLPEVFNSQKRPWIDPTKASAKEISEVVKRCPSGALKYESRNVEMEDISIFTPEIKMIKDGPLYIRGTIEVYDSGGNFMSEEGRLSLCRCGASKNKPYCDNSHLEIKFDAE